MVGKAAISSGRYRCQIWPAELTARVTSLRKGMPLRARLVSGAHYGIISAVAGIIAYVPTRALGLNEGFWSAITAIGVVQVEFHATQTTARDQLLGAAIGGLAALATLVVFGQHLARLRRSRGGDDDGLLGAQHGLSQPPCGRHRDNHSSGAAFQ